MSHMAENRSEMGGGRCDVKSSGIKSKATNPFFIFLHEFRQKLTKRGTIKHMTAKEIACAAGERWRQMSANDKLSYVVWARKNQQQSDSGLRVKAPRSQYGGKKKSKGKWRTYRGGASPSKRASKHKRRTSYIK